MDIIKIIDDLLPVLPAPPWVGPPLPIAWEIRWPAKKEPELPPKRGTLPRDVDLGFGRVIPLRKYVTRATMRKARK